MAVSTASVLLQPASQPQLGKLNNKTNNNGYIHGSSPNTDQYNVQQQHHQHTLPHRLSSSLHQQPGGLGGSNATLHSAVTLVGNANGNMSLTRNRLDLRQDNGLPNVGANSGTSVAPLGSMQSLQSSLLGKFYRGWSIFGIETQCVFLIQKYIFH